MTSLLSKLRPLAEWTAAEAAEAMGLAPPASGAGRPFGAISTDTRTIKPGEWFLAIKGENFDGHAYAATAFERGAGGLIVRPDFPPDFDARVPVLRAPDPLHSYGTLARAVRDAWGGPVLAISGSVGKTTTRRILASAISRHRKTLEPIKNFNNLIGVPCTLLQLEAEHEAAVLELGMNMPGELARLAEIARPTVAGLTRIGMTHAGMFATVEDLIRAKLQLFEGTAPGTPLVVNAACENSRRAIAQFGGSHPIVTFRGEARDGEAPGADVRIENVAPLAGEIGYRFDLETPSGGFRRISMRQFGRHFTENIACAAAMLIAGGMPVEWVVSVAGTFKSEPLRGQVVEAGDWTFILDCYNAAPDSMAAALDSLAELMRSAADGWRHVIVIADMLELGKHSRAQHEALLPRLRELGPAPFFGLGPECSRLAETLWAEGWDAHGFGDRDALVGALRAGLIPGDWVFFKGSHGFALEKAAQALAPGADIAH